MTLATVSVGGPDEATEEEANILQKES